MFKKILFVLFLILSLFIPINTFAIYRIITYEIHGNNNVPVGEETSLEAERIIRRGADINNLEEIRDFVTEDEHYFWTSSDTSIATVSDKGIVKGISEGTVIIKINQHNQSIDGGELSITVTPRREFSITTEPTDYGSLEIQSTFYGGDQISFKPIPKKGYILDGIIINTNTGRTIEINKNDLILDENGMITINNNVFIMPFENITIKAKWILEKTNNNNIKSIIKNPNTGSSISIVIIIAIIILSIGIKRKLNSI